jgi:hypothetical protein
VVNRKGQGVHLTWERYDSGKDQFHDSTQSDSEHPETANGLPLGIPRMPGRKYFVLVLGILGFTQGVIILVSQLADVLNQFGF